MLDLMDELDWTYRMLAERTRRVDGHGVRHATLNMIVNGHDRPTQRVMELVASATKMSPDYFAEYRLAKARETLDPEKVGLKRALENLENLEAARST